MGARAAGEDMETIARGLTSRRERVRTALVAVLLAVLGWVGARAGVTLATWTDSASVGSNTFATATLQPPANPAATAACDGASSAKIDLSWTGAANGTSYDVRRSTTQGGPYSFLENTANTSYTNTGLATNTTYYYVLESKRANWTSGASPEVSATTPLICL